MRYSTGGRMWKKGNKNSGVSRILNQYSHNGKEYRKYSKNDE